MSSVYQDLFDYVNSLTIIDSHEHLEPWEHRRDKNADVLWEYLHHYFSSDLVAAGMKRADMEAARDVTKPLMERWKTLEPYWNLARNTAYGRALDLSVRKLYGIDRIDGSTIEQLNEAFRKTLAEGQNHYQRVLKDLCNIEFSVLDNDLDHDKTFFRSSVSVDSYILFKSWDFIDEIEEESGVDICCFDDYLAACEAMLDLALEQGAVTLKIHAAYRRTLYFEPVSHADAEKCFLEMLKHKPRSAWESSTILPDKAFQDYMMHYILRYANRRGLTCQFHTGLQESGENDITRTDPSLMSNLFVMYPKVKFDLFHIGYPYQHVMAALGKMHTNVYLDMCWAHIISPAASMAALDDWLDSVPVNKIIGFGGDYHIIDAVYGHQLMARQNISKVLARKVEDGVYTLEEAKWMAKRILYDNGKELYTR